MEMNDNKLRDAVYSNLESNPYTDKFAKFLYNVCDTAISYKKDGVDDIDDAVSQAIDNDVIYYEDRWLMMAYYQYSEPENANVDAAFENLFSDITNIVNEYFEEDKDMDESLSRRGRMLREGRRPRGRMLREGRSSRKVTRSFLKSMVEDGEAVDITNYSDEQLHKLEKKEHRLKEIGNGFGVYGVNCGWYRGENTGTNYVVLSRNSNLFYLG